MAVVATLVTSGTAHLRLAARGLYCSVRQSPADGAGSADSPGKVFLTSQITPVCVPHLLRLRFSTEQHTGEVVGLRY